jgi:hypothetical protein
VAAVAGGLAPPSHANESRQRIGGTVTVVGHTVWAIAEGYIPPDSTGPEPQMLSHETACMLNPGDTDAHVTITVYFADREPVGPYRVVVPARRTLHQRFNDLTDPQPIPRDTDYASVIESDVPIVLLTTVAYPAG